MVRSDEIDKNSAIGFISIAVAETMLLVSKLGIACSRQRLNLMLLQTHTSAIKQVDKSCYIGMWPQSR